MASASRVMAQSECSLSSGSFAVPGTQAVGFAMPSSGMQPTLAPLSTNTTVSATKNAYGNDASNRKKEDRTYNAISQVSDSDDHTSRMEATSDTLHYGPALYLPASSAPLGGYGMPYSLGYYGGLHQGLNVNLSMSVFAQFGKHARHGAGFTQSLQATWLEPLGKRAWLAVGGYVDHTTWSGDSYTTGGLYGELGYQLSDHWQAYIYGRKSLVNSGLQQFGYGYGYGTWGTGFYDNSIGDKLGAALRWTPNDKMSLEISVEKNWLPKGSFNYPERYRYNYPMPEK